MTQTFVLPRNNSLGAYFVRVDLRPVRFQYRNGARVNVENENLVSIYTDLQFNPLFQKMRTETGGEHDDLPLAKAIEIISEFSAIPVKEDFNGHDIDDLNEIKDKLPKEWIEKWNNTHEMQIG